MKRVSLLAALALACAFSACKKDDEKPQTKTALLTAKSWRLTSLKSTSSFGGNPIDEYSSLDACRKDNYTQFFADKTVEFNEGPSRCAASDPQSRIGNWKFNADETQLSFTEPGNAAVDSYDLVELSASTLRVKKTITMSSSSLVVESTFAAF